MQVNTRGAFLCIREVARRMQEHGIAGAIVNVTSVAAMRGMSFEVRSLTPTRPATHPPSLPSRPRPPRTCLHHVRVGDGSAAITFAAYLQAGEVHYAIGGCRPDGDRHAPCHARPPSTTVAVD